MTADAHPVATRDATPEHFRAVINDKLLGQVELVRRGHRHVRDRGSFTLVSGVAPLIQSSQARSQRLSTEVWTPSFAPPQSRPGMEGDRCP